MKINPIKITPKGYYYDTKKSTRISKKEYERREKISSGLKKYWKEKKEFEETEKILLRLEEEYDILEDEKMVWYHEQ